MESTYHGDLTTLDRPFSFEGRQQPKATNSTIEDKDREEPAEVAHLCYLTFGQGLEQHLPGGTCFNHWLSNAIEFAL